MALFLSRRAAIHLLKPRTSSSSSLLPSFIFTSPHSPDPIFPNNLTFSSSQTITPNTIFSSSTNSPPTTQAITNIPTNPPSTISQSKLQNPYLSFPRSWATSNLDQAKTPHHHFIRLFSASSQDDAEPEKPPEKFSTENLQFKHQEIEGPTVERDMSALADEARQVIENLQKVMYNLSKSMALLGLAHLGCGAWIAYVTRSAPFTEVSVQSFAAFAFPFSVAFLLRRSVLPMMFFQKMEEQGRLQILTLCLQVSKCLNLLFLRVRIVSIFCVAGVSIGMLYAIWSNGGRLISG